MNKIVKTTPIIFLVLSIVFLGIAVATLLIGSSKSQIYNQMREATIVDNYDDLVNAYKNPFLLHGYIDREHKTISNNMIATRDETPVINIKVEDKSVKLAAGYGIADSNITIEDGETIIEGIKPGGDVTIYAVNYKSDNFTGIKGYELYPGTPKQYINFLKSPYNAYMLYVRIFIGVALLLFLVSMVLNIRK